ncbi:MAG TPA: 16S rRNA (adenine(1518)-N(6)/adenine(1519)-N(6))-dimethyltransferase RsmA [Rhodoblastus sp.]|nr:16S rRNA (adenine(1518)-N(6)/adenine(1519)-N(6))-dimethyltransferase RsmA [Rhodoblastus sp.]
MSDGLPPLREVVARHGLMAKKSLGQNFLFDLNLTGKIARAAGPLEDAIVLEIGPGPGGLTRALLAQGAKKVIAVERDERCLAALEEIGRAWPGRLEIVTGDALALDYPALLIGCGVAGKIRICANLPYNIGTPLLAGWLAAEPWPSFFDRMVLMFQREVAKRIVATPQERADYGRLGVLANWRCSTRILFDVPPSAFTPPPKITSSVVELTPREQPIPCSVKALEAVTLAAFGQRRKMLRQSLKSLPGADPAMLLAEAGVEPARRAEEIGIRGFCALARAYSLKRPPLASA